VEWVAKRLGFAKRLGELRFKQWMNKNAAEVLLQVGIGTGQTVLDFGCGSGTYTIPAARLVGEDGLVYALDISKTALEKVEKKAKLEGLENTVTITSVEGEVIPLKDEIVDHVLLIDVLQDIADKSALLDEVRRALKSNGFATIFPMHLNSKAVKNLAVEKGFALEQVLRERILVFRKPGDTKRAPPAAF